MSRLHHSTHFLTHAHVKKELDLKPMSAFQYRKALSRNINLQPSCYDCWTVGINSEIM